MAGDTDNIWEDIELMIDPDPFCTSCHISAMNKKAGSKNPYIQGHLSSGFYAYYFSKNTKIFDKRDCFL